MPYKDKEKLAAYLVRNREKIRARDLAYCARNREKARARASKWFSENNARAQKTAAEWRVKNKEKMRKYRKAWAIKNKDKDREFKRAYRKTPQGKARKASTAHRRRIRISESSTVTADEMVALKLLAKKCYYCGKKTKKLSFDHVTPIAKGGAHSRDNLVMACRHCNAVKGAKDPAKFARESGLLLI